MPHQTIRKPDSTPVQVTINVRVAREASETLLVAYGLCALYRESIRPGPERDAAERETAKVLQLSRWFGRMVDDA